MAAVSNPPSSPHASVSERLETALDVWRPRPSPKQQAPIQRAVVSEFGARDSHAINCKKFRTFAGHARKVLEIPELSVRFEQPWLDGKLGHARLPGKPVPCLSTVRVY